MQVLGCCKKWWTFRDSGGRQPDGGPESRLWAKCGLKLTALARGGLCSYELSRLKIGSDPVERSFHAKRQLHVLRFNAEY